MAESYAKALYDLLESGKKLDEVLQSFRSVLAARGHQKIEASVYRALIELYEQHEKSDTTVVTVAQERDVEALKKDIAATLASLGTGAKYTTMMNADVIGGYTVRVGHQYVDKSYKSALVSLYRNITKEAT